MKYKLFQPAATKSWETPTFCPCSFVCRFASLAGLGLLPVRPLSIMLSFFLSLSFSFFPFLFSLFPLSLLLCLVSPPQCIQTLQVVQSQWAWSPDWCLIARLQPPAPSAPGALRPSPGTLTTPGWTNRARPTPGLLLPTTDLSGYRWEKTGQSCTLVFI